MNERRTVIKYPDNFAMDELLARRPELADMSLNARLREMALECA